MARGRFEQFNVESVERDAAILEAQDVVHGVRVVGSDHKPRQFGNLQTARVQDLLSTRDGGISVDAQKPGYDLVCDECRQTVNPRVNVRWFHMDRWLEDHFQRHVGESCRELGPARTQATFGHFAHSPARNLLPPRRSSYGMEGAYAEKSNLARRRSDFIQRNADCEMCTAPFPNQHVSADGSIQVMDALRLRRKTPRPEPS